MMRVTAAIAALVLAALAAPALAAEKDAEYLALVDAAVAKPAEAKWCDIRNEYPDTSFFLANTDTKTMTANAGRRMLLEKSQDSVTAFKEFMRDNAGNAGAHYYAAYLYKWNNDLVKAKMEALLPDFGHGVDYINPKFESAAATALLDCIIKTGDGRSFDTAYQVISVEEQEVVADKYYHVEPVGLKPKRNGDHFYTLLTVKIPEANIEQDVYFRLDDRFVRARVTEEMAASLKGKGSASK